MARIKLLTPNSCDEETKTFGIYVLWACLNKDIEGLVYTCLECQLLLFLKEVRFVLSSNNQETSLANY